MAEVKKEPTPAEKQRARTGPCIVCVCAAFERSHYADGFHHCTCDHTQWAHRPKEPAL